MANILNIPGLEAVLGQMARRIQNMEVLGKQAFNHILIVESTTQPVLVEDGEMCLWHDTDSTGKWLLALIDGTHYKVDMTETGGSGTGDMLASVYDPTSVNDDAFDTDNHKDGTTNRVYTATEESKLAAIEASADVTDAGNVGSSIHGATAKTTPADADTIPAIDSEASNVLKKVTWANIKSTLKTYFDTLYNKYVHPNHSGDVTSVADGATTIANSAVSNAKMANMAASTFKARKTASTGAPEDVSAANVRTIINVADGSTANAKATGAEVDTATDDVKFITPKALADSTIGKAWTVFNPSITNITQGSGTLTGAYAKIGKTVHLRLAFVLAADSAVGGAMVLTFPVTIATYGQATNIGLVRFFDNSRTVRGTGFLASDGSIRPCVVSGSNVISTATSSTVPFTWATNDYMTISATFESV